MKKSLLLLVLVAMTCAATPIVAVAQAYPPPVRTARPGGDGVAACFTVKGDVDGRSVRGRVDHGSDITIAGPAGTAEANGQLEFFINNKGATLGEYQAFEDGSFTYTLGLPTRIKAGKHRIIGVVAGCGEGRVDLEVLGAGALSAFSRGPATEGASGGAGVVPRTGGVLPRTGISILSYVLVGLMLVGIGAFLLNARNRRGVRLRRSARPGSGIRVPLLDTGYFVPRTTSQRR